MLLVQIVFLVDNLYEKQNDSKLIALYQYQAMIFVEQNLCFSMEMDRPLIDYIYIHRYTHIYYIYIHYLYTNNYNFYINTNRISQ